MAPRPRRIDTSDIDVSAQRFANRRISDVKLREISEPIREVEHDESVEDVPMKGRSTIRRDRGLVRLRTVRLISKSPSPEPLPPPAEPEVEVKVTEEKVADIDPGYGSSERSSGSWRTNFEVDLDLYDRKVTSPTAKTPGESFFEKYRIKESDMHYLTIDDLPLERRDSLRRRSGDRLPSFKEICSDISSDKLTGDLNAGELRRRASLIIEEEINNIRQTESGTTLNSLEETAPVEVAAVDDKRKSRKIKKIRQKITSKTSFENPEPPIIAVIEKVEIEETAFEIKTQTPDVSVILELTDDVDNKTFKVPLRKKKKLSDVETKITCDPIVSPAAAPTVTSKENAACAETKTNERDETVVNIKAKKCDLDSKLLLDKDAVNEAPGELRKVKKVVKAKPLVKAEVPVVPKMVPLRKDPSADDFWGMMNSRETAIFTKRKQQVIEERRKTIIENSWIEEAENERKSLLKQNKTLSTDAVKTSASLIVMQNAALDLNSKPQYAQTNDRKTESLRATASVDEPSPNKSTSSESISKPEKEVSSASAKAEAKSKVAPAKVNEPKAEQKRDENVTKINKSEKSTDATKTADMVSEEKASSCESKNINEKPKENEKKEEAKVFKLQPVPKTGKAKIIDKIQNKVEAPKVPAWKLQKKVEEIVPETPKTPPWKLKRNLKVEVAEDVKFEPKAAETAKVTQLEHKIEIGIISKVELPEPTEIVKVEVPKEKIEIAKVTTFEHKIENAKISKVEIPKTKLVETVKPVEPVKPIKVGKPKADDAPPKDVEKPLKVQPVSRLKLAALTKFDTGAPPTAKPLQKKLDEKLPDAPKSPPWKVTKVESPAITAPKKDDNKIVATKNELKKEDSPKADVKLIKPKIASPKETESTSAKNESSKSKDVKIPDTKQMPSISAVKPLKKKEEILQVSSDDKSKALGEVTTQPNKSSAIDQSPKLTRDVNDQAQSKAGKKKPSESCEGQTAAGEEAKVLNETKNTQSNTDEAKPASKKSLGTLAKFPTLNNLNSITVNDTVDANQQQHIDPTNNVDTINSKTIETIAQNKAQPISIAIDPTKASAPTAPSTANKEESESETEESSYEDESEESSDEMEKKDFDPQKKVKLDFTQMRRCYGMEAVKITLVARPRPLWKIKRNRHAVFSESETESSAEEDANETRSTAGDSVTGSSQSSTTSEKKPRKKDSGRGGEEISTDNITALMPALNVQEDNEGEDNESKKKNRLSTSSHDSGFFGIGATAAKSPRKALGEFKMRAFALRSASTRSNYRVM